MLKSLLSLALITTTALAQAGASFGSPGWNDLTVNGHGSTTASSPANPVINLNGVQSVHFEISTSMWDIGNPVFFIIGQAGAISPMSFSVGFGQCTTIDIAMPSILVVSMVGVVPTSGPFVLDVPLPTTATLGFTVQAAVQYGPTDYFLTQAHDVLVTGI